MKRLVVALTPVLIGGVVLVSPITAAAAVTHGYDISWPQCRTGAEPRHPSGGAFGIVGVSDGLPWSQNPCLSGEFSWAKTLAGAPSLYMNTADPGTQSTHWGISGPDANCDPSNADSTSTAFAACAYNYGWNAAADALRTEAAPVPGATALTWWLDVETGNSWNGDATANADDVQGSIDYLKAAGVATVGVYSTSVQWGAITGGYAFPTATPNWLAGASSGSQARSDCTKVTAFGGTNSRITLVQYVSGGFDADVPC